MLIRLESGPPAIAPSGREALWDAKRRRPPMPRRHLLLLGLAGSSDQAR